MLETKEIRQMLLRTESSKLYLADYPEMLRQKVLGSPALQPMLAEIRAEGKRCWRQRFQSYPILYFEFISKEAPGWSMRRPISTGETG